MSSSSGASSSSKGDTPSSSSTPASTTPNQQQQLQQVMPFVQMNADQIYQKIGKGQLIQVQLPGRHNGSAKGATITNANTASTGASSSPHETTANRNPKPGQSHKSRKAKIPAIDPNTNFYIMPDGKQAMAVQTGLQSVPPLGQHQQQYFEYYEKKIVTNVVPPPPPPPPPLVTTVHQEYQMEKFMAAEGYNNNNNFNIPNFKQHFGQKVTAFGAGKAPTQPPPPALNETTAVNRRVEELNRWMAGKTAGKTQQPQQQHKH